MKYVKQENDHGLTGWSIQCNHFLHHDPTFRKKDIKSVILSCQLSVCNILLLPPSSFSFPQI